jgi:hypothetical protein
MPPGVRKTCWQAASPSQPSAGNLGNALYDLVKIAPVSDPRIQEADFVNRNGPYGLNDLARRLTHAAASWNAVRTAIE